MARLFVMTSNHQRHRYFLNAMAERHDLVGFLAEGRSDLLFMDVKEDDPVVARHFEERREKEEFYFPRQSGDRIAATDGRSVDYGTANSPEILEWVDSLSPDYVVLFGSSIIRPHFLSHFQGRVINLHLGLSPYYRGSGTNFWPLVNGMPECVGATIHFATSDIDGGDILAQVRPEVERRDRCHDFGCKTIIKAAAALADTISALQRGQISRVRQSGEGKVYRARDFNPEAVTRMWNNFESGMMERYLADKGAFDAKYPIVELV